MSDGLTRIRKAVQNMLNEWKEYRQYADAASQTNPPIRRLKYQQISESFSGLNRAFVTIARRFLFDADTHEVTEKTKAVTEYALRIWCGGQCEKPQDVPQEAEALRNVLPDYITRVLLSEKINEFWANASKLPKEFSECVGQIDCTQPTKEQIERLTVLTEEHSQAYKNLLDNHVKPIITCMKMSEKLRVSRQHFGNSLFSSAHKGSTQNDYWKITYEKAMAQAYARGELRRYYLCCDDPALVGRLRLTETQNDQFLKTMAVCCLECRGTQNQWAAVNKSDLTNWLAFTNARKRLSLDKIVDRTNGQPLFAEDTSGVNKLRASDRVRDHFSAVEESELSAWLEAHPNGTFYADLEDEPELIEQRSYD